MLANLSNRRDWGDAAEYVEAMWRMLQSQEPSDYVLATGVSHSVQDLVEAAFSSQGMDWRRSVRLEPHASRPNEILEARGDPRKAARALQWKTRVSALELIQTMTRAEMQSA